MSTVEEIQSGKTIEPRRIMLYGTNGIGKSTFGSASPEPIFIQTEDGLSGIECDKFPLAESFDDVQSSLQSLYETEHGYKTVVIDSLDWLEPLVWQKICEKETVKGQHVDSIEKFGYGNGYKYAVKLWDEFLTNLSLLRKDIDMNIILIAHAKVIKFKDPENESYDRYVPRINELATCIFQEWCDDVLFATYDVHTKQVGEGFGKRTQGIGQGNRIIKTTERPAYVAKNKCGLPDKIELNWNVYEEYLTKFQEGE